MSTTTDLERLREVLRIVAEADDQDDLVRAVRKALKPADEVRWDTAVDWLLNHGCVAMDWAPLFFAYTDGLITEKEMRDEAVDEECADGMPKSIYVVIEQRRQTAEVAQATGA